MFEIGTTHHWWQAAKKYPHLTNHPNTLKPLGYAHMITLIDAFSSKEILEVGHGAGSMLFSLRKSGLKMWGLDDIVEDSRVPARSLGWVRKEFPKVKFVKGLLGNNNRELPDNHFDLVCSVSVLEHVPEEKLSDFFQESFRILKPGGIMSHSLDVYLGQPVGKICDAIESAGFEWLKPAETMSVFWEERFGHKDEKNLRELMKKIVFENPLFVIEEYMWEQKKADKPAPWNFVTILITARKPQLPELHEKRLNLRILPESNIETQKKLFTTGDTSDINEFTFSRTDHLEFFKAVKSDEELLGHPLNPAYCDIRSYQEMLAYSFVKSNLPKGSKILCIGERNNRLMNRLKSGYECYCLNYSDDGKLESKLFYENDGSDVPVSLKVNSFFDFIYSAGYLQNHIPGDSDLITESLNKFGSMLSTGGISLYMFTLMKKAEHIWTPKIFEEYSSRKNVVNQIVHPFRITVDPDVFVLNRKFYEDYWEKVTGKSYDEYGMPFSYNLFMKKPEPKKSPARKAKKLKKKSVKKLKPAAKKSASAKKLLGTKTSKPKLRKKKSRSGK